MVCFFSVLRTNPVIGFSAHIVQHEQDENLQKCYGSAKLDFNVTTFRWRSVRRFLKWATEARRNYSRWWRLGNLITK